MMISDPWGPLLSQSGGGSIDMSRGFSGLGNLPPLDWMPNSGAEHGVDVGGQLPWNVAESYTFFRWYESLLFERAREEDRRLLLGGSAKTSRMLLAGKFSEIQSDPVATQGLSAGTRMVVNGVEYEVVVADENGFKVWREVGPPKSTPDWLEQFAAPFPLDPPASPPPAPPTSSPFESTPVRDPRGRDLQGLLSWAPLSDPSASPFPPTWVPPASGLGAATLTPIRGPQPASASLGDANVPPEWIFPAADRRLIQMVTGVETGNRPLNFVVNKVLLPWRNALAFAENIPLAMLIGLDDAAKRSAFSVEYEAAQDMLPLAPAMGLEMEVAPVLAYANALISTSQRLRAASRGLGTVARSPAFAFMGMGSGVGAGERGISTLGPVLESALPSGERAVPTLGSVLETSISFESSVQLKSGVLPEPTVWFARKSPYGSYTVTFKSGKTYSGMGGPERAVYSGRRIEKVYGDLVVNIDWTPAESKLNQRFDEALRIFDEGGAASTSNYNRIHTGRSVDPNLYGDFIEVITY